MHLKEKMFKELSEWVPCFEHLKKGFSVTLDFVAHHYQLMGIVMVIGCLFVASLCVSDMLFLKFLGYGWLYEWNAWHFIKYAPEALQSPEKSHWIFSLLAPMAILSLGVISLFSKKQNTLFGKAHWATIIEAKKAGVLGNDGLILGKKWGRYLRVSGFEHVFVFAPTGSGKTTSLISPNLFDEWGSIVVSDIKGTLFEETSGFRAKHGHQCFLWNPGSRDGKTHGYNPIDSVSKDPLLRVDDLQKIANILIPENPNANDPLWTSAPRQLFVALQLYLLDSPERLKTLGEMTRLIKNTPNFQAWVQDVASKGLEVKFYHPSQMMDGNFYLYTEDGKLQYSFVDSIEQSITGEIDDLRYQGIQEKLMSDNEPLLSEVNLLIQEVIWRGQLPSGSKALDPLCRRNFFQYLQNDYKLQSSILQSFLSYFELFDNPIIDSSTSFSDFDITQLKKKRMTIYVATGSDNLTRLAPLITVFYQQVMDATLRKIPILNEEPYGLTLLLDEFSALKKMESLQKNIGLMREYRVRVMAVIQNLPQLYVTYGHDGAEIFIDSKYRVAFAQNNAKAGKLISDWLGYTTVEQKSHNAQAGGAFFGGSQTTSITKIPLMNLDDIMQLNPKKMIIVIEGAAPILANKNFWFKDPNMKKLKMTPVEVTLLKAKIVPFDQAEVRKYWKEKEAENILDKKSASVKSLANEDVIA